MLPDPSNNRDCLSEPPKTPKMSAGVAGLQEKLNKSLNQKGMVSAPLPFFITHWARGPVSWVSHTR